MDNIGNASGWEHSRALILFMCHWFLARRVSHSALTSDLLMISYNNIIQGCDLSFSIYNDVYKQGYHSKKMGAYTETLLKHIYPSLFFQSYGSFCKPFVREAFLQQVDSIHNQYKQPSNLDLLHSILQTLSQDIAKQNLNRPLRILDICFGLGYNAMLALDYFKICEIYSPEKDYLLQELYNFPYHNIKDSKKILSALSKNSLYKHNKQAIYYLHGNAIKHILQFNHGFFDIVFQDAFSQQHNPELWDLHYFQILYNITTSPCIITTYAKARCVLEAAKQAGFNVLKYTWGSVFYK